VIGFAQAAALAPGVSRNGSTLAAARARGFSRTQANLLSRTVALPVIAAAAVRKATRLRRRDVDPALARSATIGVGVAFASTLASQGLIRLIERDRALWPYAAYRTALAAMIVVKDRRRRSRRNSG
jgi:undecaprenyl-diphosphatase